MNKFSNCQTKIIITVLAKKEIIYIEIYFHAILQSSTLAVVQWPTASEN